MRIALFITCIVDALFPQAAIASVKVLERMGHEVIVPPKQGCCGQMHVNTGYYPEALPLIRNHVECFEPVLRGEWDYIVVCSGSCTGSLRHQGAMVARHFGEEELAQKVELINAKTFEFCEFIVDVLKTHDVGAYFPHRVTYHAACHSHRIAKLGSRPTDLLKAVDGIDFIELPDATECCGFGGTFSMKNADTSNAMVSEKVKNIMSTGAEVVCTPDYSCLMNIGGKLSREHLPVHCMHIAEILASTRDEQFLTEEQLRKSGV